MLLRVLLEDGAALEVPGGWVELEPAHPIGLEVKDGFDAVGRHHEVKLRQLVLGLGVDLGAEPGRHVVEAGARERARAAEHHVFEGVRKPGFPRRLVERAEAIPRVDFRDRRGVILDHDDLQAVAQRARLRRRRRCLRRAGGQRAQRRVGQREREDGDAERCGEAANGHPRSYDGYEGCSAAAYARAVRTSARNGAKPMSSLRRTATP